MFAEPMMMWLRVMGKCFQLFISLFVACVRRNMKPLTLLYATNLVSQAGDPLPVTDQTHRVVCMGTFARIPRAQPCIDGAL